MWKHIYHAILGFIVSLSVMLIGLGVIWGVGRSVIFIGVKFFGYQTNGRIEVHEIVVGFVVGFVLILVAMAMSLAGVIFIEYINKFKNTDLPR